MDFKTFTKTKTTKMNITNESFLNEMKQRKRNRNFERHNGLI
jgi:hypothetical protein